MSPRGRQPRSKKAKADSAPAILRTVRLGDDLYGEGEEEELLEAMKEFEKNDKEARKADKNMSGKPFVVDEELHRLTKNGDLANFVELTDEEVEELRDPDVRANETYRRAAAKLGEGEVLENESGRMNLGVGIGRQPQNRSRGALKPSGAMVEGEEPDPESLKPKGARRRARRGPLQEAGETAEDEEK